MKLTRSVLFGLLFSAAVPPAMVTVRVFWVQSDGPRRAEPPSQRRTQGAAELA
jgi:hypothetical protein